MNQLMLIVKIISLYIFIAYILGHQQIIFLAYILFFPVNNWIARISKRTRIHYRSLR